MPTVNVNIPIPPSEAIIDTTVIPFKTLSIDKTKWYRVTDATPVPCIVSGASVGSSSALAFLEGESDGTGIIALGGTGTYDLATGTFAYGFVYDSVKRIGYIGNDLSFSPNVNGANCELIFYNIGCNNNTNGDNCANVNYGLNASSNVNGNLCDRIEYSTECIANQNGNSCKKIYYSPSSSSNINGNSCERIYYGCESNGNQNGNDSTDIRYGNGCSGNINGLSAGRLIYENGVREFIFGDNFNNCKIYQGLNGNKADDSGPIDFITGVTFLYNRSSPWEIRDIDRTNELIFLYVTYGDGSDPEEGWYDPATDTFTPIAGGSAAWGSITGTLSAQTDLQAALDAKQNLPTEVTTSITAVNGQNYIQTASATYTDPTGVQGQGYEILIVAGTATVDGIAYTSVGTKIYRYYNASAWVTSFNRWRPMPYQATGQAQSFGTSGGGTRFINIGSLFAVANTLSTQVVYYFPQGGVFSDFRFETTSAQPATGSLVITLMSGSNPASLTASSVAVTFAAGAAAGVQTSGNTLTINAGDYVCFRAQNNASTNSAGAGNTFINFTANP